MLTSNESFTADNSTMLAVKQESKTETTLPPDHMAEAGSFDPAKSVESLLLHYNRMGFLLAEVGPGSAEKALNRMYE